MSTGVSPSYPCSPPPCLAIAGPLLSSPWKAELLAAVEANCTWRGALPRSHLPCCLAVLNAGELGSAVYLNPLERGKRYRPLVEEGRLLPNLCPFTDGEFPLAERITLPLEFSSSRRSYAEITSTRRNLAKEPIWLGPCLSGRPHHTPTQSFPYHQVAVKVPPCRGRKLEPCCF